MLKKGFSGCALKWIGIITMFIDHVAAALICRILIAWQYSEELGSAETYRVLFQLQDFMRKIGRLAFPIFCFFLVEGFLRTRNIRKYMLRMLIFVFVSEIPFDLAFSGQFIYIKYQSVMLTLLIGLVTMWGCDKVAKRFHEDIYMILIGYILCVFLGALLAQGLKTDYGANGILSIMALYFCRQDKWLQLFAGAITFLWEPYALLAFPLLIFYNQTPGKRMKYFFYLFYPLHLLLICGVCAYWEILRISVIL